MENGLNQFKFAFPLIITKHMKNYLLIFALAFGISSAYSQSADKKWGLGASYGTSQYAGDHKNDFLNFETYNLKNNGQASLYLSRYLSRSFDLTFMASYGSLGIYDTKKKMQIFKSKDYYNLNAQFRYKLANGYLIEENSVIRPYLLLGYGVEQHFGYNTNEGWNMSANAGAGLNFMITDNVAIFYQLTYGYMTDDTRDKLKAGDKNDAWLLHSVGLNFNLGQSADSDGDGVSDKKDKCAGTPPNVEVDKNGCPVDKDGDGVPDYLDKCPSVAGSPNAKGCPDADKDGVPDNEDQCPNEVGDPKLHGCPDTDGDGIIDSKDKCPNVKGLKEFDGCPDTDGDGIQDSEDLCPKVAGVKLFKGCPDTDGDGIQDSEDMCPDKKGPKETKGCPDTDGDGIHDGIDKCPTIKGVAANAGCPEVKAAVKQLFQKALQGIQFETGKATIKKQSNPILDQVVKVLKDNPTYKLVIEGHTDDVGDDTKNMILSQDRANAVSQYLQSKGISPMRLTAKGLGETMPVMPNTTKAGRDKNRRVELKVEFEE